MTDLIDEALAELIKERDRLRSQCDGTKRAVDGAITTLSKVEAERDAARERIRVLEEALAKINAIRNDIIGRQTINWSAHIYPLVAALEEAGFEGEGHEVAREKAMTADRRIKELEWALHEALQLLDESVDVRSDAVDRILAIKEISATQEGKQQEVREMLRLIDAVEQIKGKP